MESKGIIIHSDIKDQLELLSDEEAGQLFKAIIAYAESGTVFSSENRVLSMIFLFIKAQIDRDVDKYKEKCRKNREVGKLGGRPRKDKTVIQKTERFQEKPNGLFENQTVSEKPNPNPIPNPIPIPNSIPNEDKGKAKRFVKPSLQEITDYVKEKGLSVDPEQFYDYYESKGWLVGRSAMKDWKAALRNWGRKDFQTRQTSPITDNKTESTTRDYSERLVSDRDYSERLVSDRDYSERF